MISHESGYCRKGKIGNMEKEVKTSSSGIKVDESAQFYYFDAVINFFFRALMFFDVIGEACESNETVEIKYMTGARENYIIYDSSMSSEQLLNILIGATGEIKINDKNFDKFKRFSLENNVEQDMMILKEIMGVTDTLFLEEDIKDNLRGKIRTLSSEYAKHREKELWSREEIDAFLECYFDILSFLFCEDSVLGMAEIADQVIKPLLNLGIRTNAASHVSYADMTAPLVLFALRLIYERLDEYRNLVFSSETNSNFSEWEKRVYQEAFLSKIFQIFRFVTVDKESDELCQTALTAYKTKEGYELKIPLRLLSTFNSYQGIRELRLGEKIIYEIERILGIDDTIEKGEYVIALIGDIKKEPLEELIRYVEERLKYNSSQFQMKLIYNIYIMGDVVNENKSVTERSSYILRKGEDIFNRTDRLGEIMESADLIFFLDCCQLYSTNVLPVENLLVLRQNYALDSYRKHYNSIKTDDLLLNCKYVDLYQMLTVFAWKGQMGMIRRQAKDGVVKYIKEVILKSNRSIDRKFGKTAYLYISDIDAFKKMNCVQEYMVRIEKYNQKQIGIVRFANNDQMYPLNGGDNGRFCIRFNLWQFVKHNLINYKNRFEKEISDNLFKPLGERDSTFCLNNVFIYIDYSEWKTQLKVSWFIEKGESATFYDADNRKPEKNTDKYMENFIKIFFIKPFWGKSENMYTRYVKDSYISFLYGNAKSVNDLVFLHILKRNPEMIGKVEFLGYREKGDGVFKGYCKYSHKKIFWEVIEQMDNRAPSIMGEYLALEKVKNDTIYAESIQSRDNDAVQSCLSDILDACEGIAYTASALYTNCKTYKK